MKNYKVSLCALAPVNLTLLLISPAPAINIPNQHTRVCRPQHSTNIENQPTSMQMIRKVEELRGKFSGMLLKKKIAAIKDRKPG